MTLIGKLKEELSKFMKELGQALCMAKIVVVMIREGQHFLNSSIDNVKCVNQQFFFYNVKP